MWIAEAIMATPTPMRTPAPTATGKYSRRSLMKSLRFILASTLSCTHCQQKLPLRSQPPRLPTDPQQVPAHDQQPHLAPSSLRRPRQSSFHVVPSSDLRSLRSTTRVPLDSWRRPFLGHRAEVGSAAPGHHHDRASPYRVTGPVAPSRRFYVEANSASRHMY